MVRETKIIKGGPHPTVHTEHTVLSTPSRIFTNIHETFIKPIKPTELYFACNRPSLETFKLS